MTFISPPVLSVLELFKGPLAGMRFADVDAEVLAQLAAQVESAGAEVASAEARLAEVRQLLASQQDALLVLAQRALAYARVYAESHDELSAALSGIVLPRPAKPRKASAAKASDSDAAPISAATAESGADAQTALASASAPAEAREVELDPEPSESNAQQGMSARKSRRNRSPVADAESVRSGSASASE